MVEEAGSSHNPQTIEDSSNWKNDIFSKVKKGLKKEDVCVVLARFPDIQALAPMQTLELKS